MSLLLIVAIFVAVIGFGLLLVPERLWRPFRKDPDAVLSSAMGALLRLVGIGLLFLAALIAQLG